MAAVLEKPSLLHRLAPVVQGFDGPLAFAVFLLACAGLLTMYSSGFDHASNTRRAGASKRRVTTTSRSDFRSTFVMFFTAASSPCRLASI